MAIDRSWEAYPLTYRAREIKTLAGWIAAGLSGSVVGLAGSGKSNLLGFACHRPEALQPYLPPAESVALVPVDLNNLPASTLATFYRVVLRSFYEIRERLRADLQPKIAALYVENRAARDPFLPQSALRELLFEFQARQTRVVLVMDRFDRFCQAASPLMLDTLRGLRDSFKTILSYIVGTRQEVVYLFDPAELGEMYEILDTHVCWVGAMDEPDARRLMAEEMSSASSPPSESELARLLALSGGYPALLKAACHWWLNTPLRPKLGQWAEALLNEPSLRTRLAEVWGGLTQEEQQTLVQVQRWQAKTARLGAGSASMEWEHRRPLARLAAKGFYQQMEAGGQIVGELFDAYVASAGGQARGRVWLDDKTDELYQGQDLLEGLAPLERAVLHFLVRHPRLRHAKTDLIVSTWPDELRRHGVTDDSLYQVIRELRKKIEPDPARPCYIVTWRGQPEGGYQFFPEGKPG
jgi:hypothetical protein